MNERKKNDYAEAKLPPNDIETEKAVLGAILIHADIFPDVNEILKTADCFYDKHHQTIYSVILKMFAVSATIDILTVTSELNKSHPTENMNWVKYCFNLSSDIVTTSHTIAHCYILVERYMSREVIKLGHTLVSEGYKQENDVFDVVELANKGLTDLTERNISRIGLSASELALMINKHVSELQKPDAIAGVRSGYGGLDVITNGWGREWLVILAARPGVGKSAFAINLMINAATNKVPVAFFSLEMSLLQVTGRCISILSSVEQWKITQPRSMRNAEDMKDFIDATKRFSELPIFIDDTVGITPLELRTKARRLKQKHNIGMIIVDYLQLMEGGIKTSNREAEISYISRSLKKIAKELGVPLIALAQLSRATESRQSKVPILSDLRESGGIEQDADMVMFLYRPEYYGIETNGAEKFQEGLTQVHVAKNRHGSAQLSVDLIFEKELQKFSNIDVFKDDIPHDNPSAGIHKPLEQHYQQLNEFNDKNGFADKF